MPSERWRSTYDAWKLRSDMDDPSASSGPGDYDAEDDARKCYLVALKAKKARGDRHDWLRQNMLDSAANDLLEGKPMNETNPNPDFAADLTNMIGRYLEAGTPADEILATLQEAIEEIEGEAVEDPGDELAGDDEGKPDDDEMT